VLTLKGVSLWPQISVQTVQLPSRVTVDSFPLQSLVTMSRQKKELV